ncbi:hypothetical protein KIN20_030428 [Parelaphostrongylus tenuis]|uniref:Uncharacterized protein n=1 Tax=Parelaphostrongylus tenuis TaxID=148309 RepID=A0AAD5R422_PARTN|nr:hypothetical protein KIN20_030428 [Parelaphostrongylus tenuis]
MLMLSRIQSETNLSAAVVEIGQYSFRLADASCYKNDAIRRRLMCTSERNELWRECVRWMTDMGVLDQRLAPTSSMLEFATMLRDGVLLCRLLNELAPNCVEEKEIQRRPHMSEFTCHKNICLFLGACKSVFHLKSEQMFEAWELFRLQDFAKVLSVLSMLSYSEPALQKNIKPFPSATSSSSSSPSSALPPRLHPPPEEEAIYRSLQDDLEKVDLAATLYDISPLKNEEEEPHFIYDHIIWSSFSPSSKREHCMKELLDTEQNYVEKALNMIINKFYEPLQKVFRETDHKLIFMNIMTLWNLHHSFYSDLRHAVLKTLGLIQSTSTDGRPTSLSLGNTIGDVFVQHKDKFIAYGPYCMGLDDSRARILELEKSDPIAKAKIYECTSSVNDNQFKLQDLLCLPMQRVLKYHILLSELIKTTSLDAPDRKSLELAKEAMDDVNSYINEMKRDNETKQLIEEVQSSITELTMPDSVTLRDCGRRNADGEVRLAESTSQQFGKMKQRHVFIFDKVLIICKANRNNTYTYKSGYIISELHPTLDNPMPDVKMGTISRLSKASNTSVQTATATGKWLNHFELARLHVMDCANFCEELKATATEPIPMVDLDTRQLAEQDPLAVAAMVVEKLLSKEREVPDEEKVRGVNIATNTPGTEERPRTPPRSEKTVKTRGRRPKKNNQTEQVPRRSSRLMKKRAEKKDEVMKK